jgi:hypothetical protein
VTPGFVSPIVEFIGFESISENRNVFQQRNDAEDDHHNARDLLGATIDRQHVDQIEDENNDKKCNQGTNNHFDFPRLCCVEAKDASATAFAPPRR